MDVQLPNGNVISGVPENATKEQIMQKAIESGLATPEDFGQQMPEGGVLESVYEPAKAIASGIAGTVVGGLKGGVDLLTGKSGEEAAQSVQSIQEGMTSVPQTQAGIKGMETVGDLIDYGVDLARFPISGLAGLASIISGQGVDKAASIVKDINNKGVSETAGNLAFEQTGSPLLATAAYMTPEIVGSIIPAIRLAKNRSAFQTDIANKLRDAQANPQISQALNSMGDYVNTNGIDQNIIAALNDIKKTTNPVLSGKIDDLLEDARLGIEPETLSKDLRVIAQDAGKPTAERGLVDYMLEGSGKAKKDPLAISAVEQGFDDGVVASLKAATPEDKVKMSQMVDIMERAKKDALYSVDNRASDIAGDSLLDRVNHIKEVNTKAGKAIDTAAQSFKESGVGVDLDKLVRIEENFLTRLEGLGIKLDGNLKPVFDGSDIEGVTSAENAIKNIVKRMSSGGEPKAYDLHRLKRYIDEQVTFGKSEGGLSGRVQATLKSLRRDVDGVLDEMSPEYNQANTIYGDTVNALDSIQSVAGGKMDLFGENADKAVGVLLRRMMGNTQSRVNLMDSMNDIESIARKYGGDFPDDIKMQMLFADELDSVFGTTARTSFQGAGGEAVKRGIEVAAGQKTGLGMLKDAATGVINRKAKINDEEAFRVIKELLERQ